MDPDMVARLRSMDRNQLAAMAGVSPQMVHQLLAQMSLDGGGMGRPSPAGNFHSSNEPGKAPPVFDNVSPNLPRPGSFTPAEIRRKRTQYAQEIFQSHARLRKILEHHEETIQKRWLKKTRDQRKRILLDAWPNMPAQHRPDLQALLTKNGPEPSADACKWPLINLEDLTTPKLFLIFLNARGRNPPSLFAGFDNGLYRLGFVLGIVRPAFLNEYTMMFTGRDSVEKYGELLAWDKHSQAFDWLHTGRGVHPGEGILVMEIQSRIYRFLLDCSLALMQIPPDVIQGPGSLGKALEGSSVKPEPAALSTSEPGVISLAAVTAEGPYRKPTRLDLDRLLGLVAAKLSAAEDHIWALREDPGYFAEVALEMKEHRLEQMIDINGQKHSYLKTPPFRQFWDRVLGLLIIDAYLAIAYWDDMHSQIQHPRELLNEHAANIKYEKDLPRDVLKAFLALDYSIQNYTKAPIQALKLNVPASPPLRNAFVRLPEGPNPDLLYTELREKPSDKSFTRLRWALATIWDEQKSHLLTLPAVMDEVERIVHNDP